MLANKSPLSMNLKGVYFGILSNIFGSVLMLGATLWLTRILDPEEFGQFRVGSNFATLMIPLLALGGERLISSIIQRESGDSLPVSRALVTMIFIVATGLFMLSVSYPLLSKFIFDGTIPAGIYYASIAIIPLTIAYNVANTIWRHTGDPALAQIDLNFTQRLTRAPLLIGCSFLWPGALAASLAMTAAQAVSLFRIRRNIQHFSVSGIGSPLAAVRMNFRGMLAIGLPVAIMASVDRLDVLLVNAVMGVKSAGSYDLIFMLSVTAMFPAMALSKTAEPFLYGMVRNPEKNKQLKSLQTRTFLLSCISVLAIAVIAPFLEVFLGNADSNFSEAALILSAGLAFSSAHGPALEYLQINGKVRLTLSVVVSLMLLFFVLKYFVASVYSLTGVAALAGLFYFTLRLFLSIYIRLSENVSLAHPATIFSSFLGYFVVALYIWAV
ncbi:Membrane protein involved in the export of O-antigen and teichoic acid [Marinobacter sp. DSM 26671]|uniref:lipopolysaccharide biosynthesis protein n=1 Tax=Marinobacter sp. DSM 26671 TaxID=1761793 RepID=UPI0008E4FE46|nr:oligosaccharide flippase family protein [Marinobacter sp. DSM 26671]SFE23829.1 Membrane protein involved in the export of O-antigen and teichoic acid [Marinobacter sp. DSM 26671]